MEIQITNEVELAYVQYKNNKNQDTYTALLTLLNLPDYHSCENCGNAIFYYDSNISIYSKKNKNIVSIKGKSYKSERNIFGKRYKLALCEKCLTQKKPDYQLKNKSRVFNLTNDITAVAYSIPLDIAKKFRQENNSCTKANMIHKYGKDDGEKRWASYCKRQRITNTFEYKNKKFGMSQEAFHEFNKSRAVTQQNLCNKYGNEEGKTRWDSYIAIQKETKSLNYMIDKFGYGEAMSINKSKARTLENFIKQYGNDEGNRKYIEYINKKSDYYSSVSQVFFKRIDVNFNKKSKTYYAEKNGEFGVMTSIGYKKLDYFILNESVCIEYNGNVFHGGPMFNDNDKPNPWSDISAKQMREKDIERYEILFNEKGIRTFVVWEGIENSENLIQEIENFILNKNIKYKQNL